MSCVAERQMVCLKIEIHEIHKIYEIHMPKYRNPSTKYEIHCLKIEIHKGHEIHSKATLAKYRAEAKEAYDRRVRRRAGLDALSLIHI